MTTGLENGQQKKKTRKSCPCCSKADGGSNVATQCAALRKLCYARMWYGQDSAARLDAATQEARDLRRQLTDLSDRYSSLEAKHARITEVGAP